MGEAMEKRIQVIFLLLITAVILSLGVGAGVLQLQNDNLKENTNIGYNNAVDEIKSDEIKSNAQVAIDNSTSTNLELHFLDVGQGDSTLVILPDGKTMLIDAGTSKHGSTVVNYLKALKISKIDYLVMTHPDADHIGGMSKVIDNFDIGTIYMTDRISTTKTFEDLLIKIGTKDLKITTPEANDIISESDDFKAMFLSPIKKYDNNNDMSLVIHITHKNNTFLLMGDAGIRVENDLLNSNANINADLIKIGHHGSAYSSSAKFIEKVSPLFAIISSGEGNKFGHPSPVTLETLDKNGVKVYRTDELGHIVAVSDGKIIKIDYKT